MKSRTWAKSSIIILTIVNLLGCSKHDDLHRYIEETLARPPRPIEPLPQAESYVPYKYSVAELRSPFLRPQKAVAVTNTILPDLNRPKEELEAFSLDALKMVGTLGAGKSSWALLSAPNGGVYRITVGGYLGKNYGRVSKITKDYLELIETVEDGQGGWTQRTAKIQLATEGK